MEHSPENDLLSRLDLRSLIRDVMRGWLIILLLSVSMALFVKIYTEYTYKPQYTTSTTFTVNNVSGTNTIYKDLAAAQSLAERFTQIINTNLLRKRVVEDLGLSYFDASASVKQVSSTNLVVLSVTSDNPMKAYQIINSIMENYSSITDYVIGEVVLNVIQDPDIPSGPVNLPNVYSRMKKVFLLTAVMVILLLAVLSYMRDTVKNEDQVADKVDAKLLGVIYHEKKAFHLSGKKTSRENMLITNPMRSFRYIESSRLAASKVMSSLKHRHKNVVLVTSVMENEGKSTVASNLALGIAQNGKNVLLIDCDFRKPSLYKIFDEKEKRQTADIVKDKNTGLYTIFLHSAKDAERILHKQLTSIIDTYKDRMDYIILDISPMGLVYDAEEIARYADASILVIRQDVILAKHINDAIDTLNRSGSEVIGCVFNNARKKLAVSNSYGGYGGYNGYGGYGKYGSYGGKYGKS